tara:strand:+ start:2473 stop:2748 length:276 start_codon:yes stop_codon:yes gene_type:complete
MHLSRAIKLCRQSKGLTQKALACKAKLSTSYLSLLERNKRDLNIKVLEEIADAMDISVVLLIFLAAEEEEIPELSVELKNEFKQLIVGVIK